MTKILLDLDKALSRHTAQPHTSQARAREEESSQTQLTHAQMGQTVLAPRLAWSWLLPGWARAWVSNPTPLILSGSIQPTLTLTGSESQEVKC